MSAVDQFNQIRKSRFTHEKFSTLVRLFCLVLVLILSGDPFFQAFPSFPFLQGGILPFTQTAYAAQTSPAGDIPENSLNGLISLNSVNSPGLDKASVTLYQGSSTTLHLNNNRRTVKWSVQDARTVSLSKKTKNSVRVTARKRGTTVVTARISGTGQVLRCSVTVRKKARIALVDVPSLNKGGNADSVARALRKAGAKVTCLKTGRINPSKYDGLVIPGGIDVDPASYHEKRSRKVKACSRKLDKIQLEAIDRFVRARKPVLGICRGCQLINISFGGTLKQHISGHAAGKHSLETTPGSWMYELFGSSMTVPTTHHQAVDIPGSRLRITQRAGKDQSPEALEHLTLPIYGVQWHPELSGKKGEKVFREFVRKCEK